MAITLPDARLLSDEVLEALRLRAVHGCELGFTEADVADLLGISRETVSRWWSAYVQQGPGALPGDRTGRPIGTGRTTSATSTIGAAEDTGTSTTPGTSTSRSAIS